MKRWDLDFLTRPADATPLAALRIGIAGVLLVQAVFLAPALLDLYGRNGFLQWPIAREMVPAGVPQIGWLIETASPLGIPAEACVRIVFLLYVAALTCLLLGWQTRIVAIAAWLGHLALCISGMATIYGVDAFARIALFYCVVMPVGHAMSLDRSAGRVPTDPTFAARLGLRVLQVHVCIAYFAAGLSKAQGEQWWNGEAIWLALNQPTLARFDPSLLADYPWVAMVAGWGTVVIEVGYPIFVWWRRTRTVWTWLTISMHIGIAVGLGLVSFAAVMIVLNVAAFLIPAESDASRSIRDSNSDNCGSLRNRDKENIRLRLSQ